METLERVARESGRTAEDIAGSLLSHTLGQLAFEPAELEALLDATPGFREQFLESIEQIRRGETIPASELRER